MIFGTEIKTILDRFTGVIYCCPPKRRQFIGFSFSSDVLESKAFCSACSDSESIIAGYEFQNPANRQLAHLVSTNLNKDLWTAFTAMLALDALTSVTPYTPSTILHYSGRQDYRIDLMNEIGKEKLVEIENSDPPDIRRVFSFLRKKEIFGAFDSRREKTTFTNEELRSLASEALDTTTDEIIQGFLAPLSAP